jgi:hypothetical protein
VAGETKCLAAFESCVLPAWHAQEGKECCSKKKFTAAFSLKSFTHITLSLHLSTMLVSTALCMRVPPAIYT